MHSFIRSHCLLSLSYEFVFSFQNWRFCCWLLMGVLSSFVVFVICYSHTVVALHVCMFSSYHFVVPSPLSGSGSNYHILATSPPHSLESDADKGYESRTDSTYERPLPPERCELSSSRPGPPTAPKSYKYPDGFLNGCEPSTKHVPSASKPPPPPRSFSNQLYMDPGDLQVAQNTSKDTYSSRDSGLPSSLERKR